MSLDDIFAFVLTLGLLVSIVALLALKISVPDYLPAALTLGVGVCYEKAKSLPVPMFKKPTSPS